MKKLILAATILCFSITGLAQNSSISPSELVKSEASKSAATYLNLIPSGQEKEYGFNNRNEFEQVKYGEPYKVYFTTRENGKVNLLASNSYRVPLTVNGKYVALLTVQLKNGKAQVVDFGAAKLAQKIQAFETSYTAKNERVLLRNTHLSKDYIVPEFDALCNLETNGNKSVNTNSKSVLYPISATDNQAVVKPDVFAANTLKAELK